MKDGKVILFDCFGLFASDSVDDFFKDHYPENHQELKDSFCEEGDSGAFDFDTLLENMARGLNLNQAALTEEINRRRVLYPRMIELAKRLRENHRVYLLSNCIRGVIESIFEGTGFEDCFDGQIRSCDIGLVKPKPEIFAYAKKALGNPERIVFFDDNPINVEAARKEGIESYVYHSPEQVEETLRQIGY
ncbi:MAG: HAD family hydrolase [Erysipelotrichaceae bacterium]|jgi:HAD superfamily hydrolase (TIGR01509 family)|nr:HAD family hydrolase [Erysipelotrichaceae bacterium]